MNLYNADHIANSQEYREGYDLIRWNDTAEERMCCGACSGDCGASESGDKGVLDVGSFSWLFGL